MRFLPISASPFFIYPTSLILRYPTIPKLQRCPFVTRHGDVETESWLEFGRKETGNAEVWMQSETLCLDKTMCTDNLIPRCGIKEQSDSEMQRDQEEEPQVIWTNEEVSGKRGKPRLALTQTDCCSMLLSVVQTCSFLHACVHQCRESCLWRRRLAPIPLSLFVSISVSISAHVRGLTRSSVPVLLGLHGFEFPGVLVALVVGFSLVLWGKQ